MIVFGLALAADLCCALCSRSPGAEQVPLLGDQMHKAERQRAAKARSFIPEGGVRFVTVREGIVEVMTKTIVNLLNNGGIQMLIDDIKKSQLLGISYGEYMALKKDFYSEEEEKALRATVRMAELMQKASDRIKEEKRD